MLKSAPLFRMVYQMWEYQYITVVNPLLRPAPCRDMNWFIPWRGNMSAIKCSQTSTETGTLMRHELIHSGEEAHVCKYCGESYTQACGLKRHELVHTRKRQHFCNSCGHTFTGTGTSKRHAFIHGGEMAHFCTYRGRSFTQAGDLKRHELIHR